MSTSSALAQEIFNECNVFMTGHFVYHSGRHGNTYVDKDALLAYPRMIKVLCHELARRFASKDIQTVIAPAIGGVILSHRVADALHQLTGREVCSVYAEEDVNGSFSIRKTYHRHLCAGQRTLVVDDVLTTGASTRNVVNIVRSLGGCVVGVGALCNRGYVTCDDLDNVPRLVSLLDISLNTWAASECHLCKQKVPINTEVGYGREFLTEQKRESKPDDEGWVQSHTVRNAQN